MTYNLPTFNFFNLEQGKFLSEIVKNSDTNVNLVYSYYQVIWQGPFIAKHIFEELNTKKVTCLIDCQDNIEYSLSFLRIGIKKIIVKIENKVMKKKLLSLAKNSGSELFEMTKFKKKQLFNDVMNNDVFKKKIILKLKKNNILV